MPSPFKLDAHPRRPHPPLSSPPAGYFEALPMRVMARLPLAEAPATVAPGWGWLARLAPGLRTGLASVVVLGGFAAAFVLSSPPPPGVASAPAATLDRVPRTELVGYLLTSGAHVEATDLALLTAADPALTNGFLRASDQELTDALDAQPADEPAYL